MLETETEETARVHLDRRGDDSPGDPDDGVRDRDREHDQDGEHDREREPDRERN